MLPCTAQHVPTTMCTPQPAGWDEAPWPSMRRAIQSLVQTTRGAPVSLVREARREDSSCCTRAAALSWAPSAGALAAAWPCSAGGLPCSGSCSALQAPGSSALSVAAWSLLAAGAASNSGKLSREALRAGSSVGGPAPAGCVGCKLVRDAGVVSGPEPAPSGRDLAVAGPASASAAGTRLGCAARRLSVEPASCPDARGLPGRDGSCAPTAGSWPARGLSEALRRSGLTLLLYRLRSLGPAQKPLCGLRAFCCPGSPLLPSRQPEAAQAERQIALGLGSSLVRRYVSHSSRSASTCAPPPVSVRCYASRHEGRLWDLPHAGRAWCGALSSRISLVKVGAKTQLLCCAPRCLRSWNSLRGACIGGCRAAPGRLGRTLRDWLGRAGPARTAAQLPVKSGEPRGRAGGGDLLPCRALMAGITAPAAPEQGSSGADQRQWLRHQLSRLSARIRCSPARM